MEATFKDDLLATADAGLLKKTLRKADRRRKLAAFSLTAPLLAFVVAFFLIPLAKMLWLSVSNPTIDDYMPQTVAAIRDWTPKAQIPARAYQGVVQDLQHAFKDHTFGRVANRLNQESPGAFDLITKTTMRVRSYSGSDWKNELLNIDPRWGKPEIWQLLKHESAPITMDYYVAALDMQYNVNGRVVKQPRYARVFVPLFLRTFWMSAVITILTVLLGYPLAYWMNSLPTRKANIAMIAVLLPFWTSLLVRTTAWIVLLQSHGVINDFLIWVGVVNPAHRLHLIYNQLGTTIAMTQVLLPFMVLPLYSVMKGIQGTYFRAALSLGATPSQAFWKVYFPLSLPGVGAGAPLVFILAIGYYITPDLVGGQSGQFISSMIAYNVQQSLNWGLAAALGTILTIAAVTLYFIYSTFFGGSRVKWG